MTLHTYDEIEQGSEEWLQARCGILTASVMGQLITAKTLAPARNDTARSLTMHLAAERITNYVEETFVSRDMEMGVLCEPYARDAYSELVDHVEEVGFMLREYDGMKVGFSPDGLVRDEGLIEIKTRRAKKHLATVIAGQVPAENMAQIQCGLWVTGRSWCDYISFSGGLPLWIKRVHPDHEWFTAIERAVELFEENVTEIVAQFNDSTKGMPVMDRVDPYMDIEVLP